MLTPQDWLIKTEFGMYNIPGDFHIDPMQPVKNAVISHAHADHARAGHQIVAATPETLAIMQCRYGEGCAENYIPLKYDQVTYYRDVRVFLKPAGHILGSAQVFMEYKGQRIGFSGDYKRAFDPTCPAFQATPCDVFITEATFGLPVFLHPPIREELNKLLFSLSHHPHRCHLIGAYALGKCQRLIMELRRLGYNKTIYLHGAHVKLCDLYESLGIDLGELIPVSQVDDKRQLAGELVFAPPSALRDRWSRRLPEVKTCLASGWMKIRARAKQKLVELPLVVSDHCDWNELLQTIKEVNPKEVWVTHGHEDTLIYALNQLGFKAKPFSIAGFEEDLDT